MYSQLLYFVIALLLFSIQQPGGEPAFDPLETILFAGALFLSFSIACKLVFGRLMRDMYFLSSSPSLTHRYLSAQTRLTVLALANLAIYVYILNIKHYLVSIPWVEQSLTILGLAGLSLFIAHLAVIWACSHKIYGHLHHTSITAWKFIRSNLAFCSAILIPWFLVSVVSDLIQFLDLPAFFETDNGQFLVLGTLLVGLVLFAPRLIVRLWSCQPLPDDTIRLQLERFAHDQRFKVGDFLLWPLLGGEILTAGIIGILPKWRYILITRGLLKLLEMDELRAVVAHEIGHVRRYHILIFLLLFISYTFVIDAIDDVILVGLLHQVRILDWLLDPKTGGATFLSAVYSIPMVLLMILYFRFVFGFFLRNSERQADLYALQVMGDPYALVSSLRKIAYFSGRTEDLPSWHHFSIRQRIEFLIRAFNHPNLVKAHQKKYYSALIAFFLAVALICVASNRVGNSRFFHTWRIELQVKILEKELTQKQDNPGLFSAYGGLLMELQDFDRAEAALQRSLTLDPDNALTLNNLAWLYATAPPPHFNPEAALELALQAAAKAPKPAILDTLAEAYFVNGQPDKALAAIEEALAKESANRDYLMGQKHKYEKALEKN